MDNHCGSARQLRVKGVEADDRHAHDQGLLSWMKRVVHSLDPDIFKPGHVFGVGAHEDFDVVPDPGRHFSGQDAVVESPSHAGVAQVVGPL